MSNEKVPSLQVTVVTADIQPATHDAELPTWGNSQLLSDITAGKPGGYGSSEGYIGEMSG